MGGTLPWELKDIKIFKYKSGMEEQSYFFRIANFPIEKFFLILFIPKF